MPPSGPGLPAPGRERHPADLPVRRPGLDPRPVPPGGSFTIGKRWPRHEDDDAPTIAIERDTYRPDRRRPRRAELRAARQGGRGRARAGLPAGAGAPARRGPARPGQDDPGQGPGQALGGKFARVQCTPDLLPGDITGFRIFDQHTREFEFLPGPVFADVPAGRRDQPHHAAHPECPAGGHGRAPGHGGQRPARACRTPSS